MIKYYNYMVVFEEIPNEITLAINITNCPCKCEGCHSKFLWADVGTELNHDELDRIIEANKGITCVCFMGGDADPSSIDELASYMRSNSKYDSLKVAWYSGRDKISDDIDVENFDYIKVGPYIEWLGGLDKETTNQRMYEIESSEPSGFIMEDITHLFWERKKNKI